MVHLRQEATSDRPFPRVLFVHQGDVEQGEEFFDKFYPDAAAVADPNLELYRAFGVEKGGWSQFVKPGYWGSVLRAMSHGMGKPQGDVMRNPGAFLVRDGEIVLRQEFEHFGAPLELEAFRAAAAAA